MKVLSFMHKNGSGVFRFFGLPFAWAGSYEYGTWWVGIGRWRLIVNGPWNEPRGFRNDTGLQKNNLGFGWRVKSCMVN